MLCLFKDAPIIKINKKLNSKTMYLTKWPFRTLEVLIPPNQAIYTDIIEMEVCFYGILQTKLSKCKYIKLIFLSNSKQGYFYTRKL